MRNLHCSRSCLYRESASQYRCLGRRLLELSSSLFQAMAPSTAGQAQAIIPDIPGQVVPDEIANFLKEHVSQLTGSGSRE